MRGSVALIVYVSLSNPDHRTVQQQLISADCEHSQHSGFVPLICESLDAKRLNDRLEMEGSRSFIPKRSFSEDRRVVFVAGLEGTGHHFWRDIFEVCTAHGDCVRSPDLATSLWSQNDKNGLFNNYQPNGDYDAEAVEGVRSALQGLSGTGGLHWVNGAHRHGTGKTGMMSYPNFGGPEKIYQHPDIWELAQIAEDAGEDLRILFLGRQARPLLTSTAVHRHFSPYGTQAVILAHNARVLASQINALDVKFVHCVEYERMPNLPSDLSAWLDPAEFEFDAAAENYFKGSHSHQQQEALPVDPHRDLAIAHLEEALAELHAAAGCPDIREE